MRSTSRKLSPDRLGGRKGGCTHPRHVPCRRRSVGGSASKRLTSRSWLGPGLASPPAPHHTPPRHTASSEGLCHMWRSIWQIYDIWHMAYMGSSPPSCCLSGTSGGGVAGAGRLFVPVRQGARGGLGGVDRGGRCGLRDGRNGDAVRAGNGIPSGKLSPEKSASTSHFLQNASNMTRPAVWAPGNKVQGRTTWLHKSLDALIEKHTPPPPERSQVRRWQAHGGDNFPEEVICPGP